MFFKVFLILTLNHWNFETLFLLYVIDTTGNYKSVVLSKIDIDISFNYRQKFCVTKVWKLEEEIRSNQKKSNSRGYLCKGGSWWLRSPNKVFTKSTFMSFNITVPMPSVFWPNCSAIVYIAVRIHVMFDCLTYQTCKG